MTHCWFLCHSYNPTRISPFFEGELKFVRKIFLAVYSFKRKIDTETKIYKKKIDVKNVLMEPLNPSNLVTTSFIPGKKIKKAIFGNKKLDKKIKEKIEGMNDKDLKKLKYFLTQQSRRDRRNKNVYI